MQTLDNCVCMYVMRDGVPEPREMAVQACMRSLKLDLFTEQTTISMMHKSFWQSLLYVRAYKCCGTAMLRVTVRAFRLGRPRDLLVKCSVIG